MLSSCSGKTRQVNPNTDQPPCWPNQTNQVQTIKLFVRQRILINYINTCFLFSLVTKTSFRRHHMVVSTSHALKFHCWADFGPFGRLPLSQIQCLKVDSCRGSSSKPVLITAVMIRRLNPRSAAQQTGITNPTSVSFKIWAKLTQGGDLFIITSGTTRRWPLAPLAMPWPPHWPPYWPG